MAVVLMPEMPAEVFAEEQAAAYRHRRAPCLVILGPDFSIISQEPQLAAVIREAGLGECPPCRLPAEIESAARELAASARGSGGCAETVLAVSQLLVRITTLVGPTSSCVAVSLEKLRSRDPLNSAAARFGLSPRELQVLKLIMSGFDRKAIATRLFIAESTVGEYFKHLYAKVGVRNRSALFASVFQWTGRDYPKSAV